MSPTHLAIESAAQEVEKLLNGQLLIALVNNASGVTNPGPVQRLERENFGTRNVTNTFLPYLGPLSNVRRNRNSEKLSISTLFQVFLIPRLMGLTTLLSTHFLHHSFE